MSIMVVEDEAWIRLLLENLLEDEGHKIAGSYQSSRDAIDALHTTKPDAVLLDINLGKGGTGFDVAKACQDHGISFAFLTGYTNDTVPIPSDIHPYARLSKPFLEHQVLDLVKNLKSESVH